MNKFFIVGCQRSGTTLMRLMMNSHPQTKCYGESKAYDALENGFSLEDDKLYYGFQTPIWTELFVEYDCIREKLRRTPENPQGFPVVFMIRNVLDVIGSMKSMPAGWLDREIVQNMKLWATDAARRVYSPDTTDPIVDAAYYWMYKTESLLRMINAGYKVLPVVYEDLVTRPQEIMEKILSFLEIPWDGAVLHHNLLGHSETNFSGITMGGTNSHSPVYTTSVGNWRQRLNAEEVYTIMHETKFLRMRLEHQGYYCNIT